MVSYAGPAAPLFFAFHAEVCIPPCLFLHLVEHAVVGIAQDGPADPDETSLRQLVGERLVIPHPQVPAVSQPFRKERAWTAIPVFFSQQSAAHKIQGCFMR